MVTTTKWALNAKAPRVVSGDAQVENFLKYYGLSEMPSLAFWITFNYIYCILKEKWKTDVETILEIQLGSS